MNVEQADRMSDRIVNLINEEKKAGDRPDPPALLAGLCLGMLAFLKTAPEPMPLELAILEETLVRTVIVCERL